MPNRPRTVALACLVVAAASVGASPRPDQQSTSSASPPPTGVILGRTVDGVTGAPIGGAAVTISAAPTTAPAAVGPATPATLGRFPQRVLSDAEGRFVFHDLPKGSYIITGGKSGYADGGFGRRAPSDANQTLILADAERRGELTIPLWKYGSIGGTVVDEAAEPLIGVTVRAFRKTIGGGRATFAPFGGSARTDDRGVYRISGLAPGEYLVGIVLTEVAVPTSFQQAWGASVGSDGGQRFQRELQRSSGLGSFSLVAGAGQPVGSSRLIVAGGAGAADAPTPPPVEKDKVFIYPPTFHPGVTNPAQATVVTLQPAEAITTIDFQLRPEPSSQISGTLTGPQGPEPFTVLNLVPSSASGFQRDDELVAASTVSDSNGAFVFIGVAPGSYSIRVLKTPLRPVTTSSATTVIQTGTSMIVSSNGPATPAPIADGPTLWANIPVSVESRDVTGVQVQLATGARITGRVQFEGSKTPPTAAQLRQVNVIVDSADGRTLTNQFQLTRGSVDEAGQFTTYQFPPGRYVVRAIAPLPGWTFKGAFLGERNVTDGPLEIEGKDVADVAVTFTDRTIELTGAVHSSQGPDAASTVIVFPQRAELWRDHGPTTRAFWKTRVASDSTYRITSLPAGDYLIVALGSVVPQDWQDPEFLRKLAPLATHVTLADGDKKSTDLETRQIR